MGTALALGDDFPHSEVSRNLDNFLLKSIGLIICFLIIADALMASQIDGPNLFAQQLVGTTDWQTSQWRKTKDGWLDLSKWNRPEPIRVERRIELVHPLLFTAIIILASSALMIWATEEMEWARLIEQDAPDR